MSEPASMNRLLRQDLVLLEAAETLLDPARPDQLDLNSLATLCGTSRQIILEAFPWPEMLAVGVLVAGWEREGQGFADLPFRPGASWDRVVEVCHIYERTCLRRPNGFLLESRGWEPDPVLLDSYAAHPVVCSYISGGSRLLPMLRCVWPDESCLFTPESLVTVLRDRLYRWITTGFDRVRSPYSESVDRRRMTFPMGADYILNILAPQDIPNTDRQMMIVDLPVEGVFTFSETIKNQPENGMTWERS